MKLIKTLIIIFLIIFLIYYFTFLRYLIFPNPEIKSISMMRYNPNLKIAICISGQFRDIQTSIKNHKILKELKPDFFIYADDNLNLDEKGRVLDFYKPISFVWDNKDVKQIKNYPKNMLFMFKRLYYCDLLRQHQEQKMGKKYDVVIRLRPDLLFKERIPDKIINNIQKDSIYFPVQYKGDIWWKNVHGPTDMISISDSDTMKKYSSCYNNLENMDVDSCIGEKIIANHFFDLIGNVNTFKMGFVLADMRFDLTKNDLYNLLVKKIWNKRQFLRPKALKQCLENNKARDMVIKYIEI